MMLMPLTYLKTPLILLDPQAKGATFEGDVISAVLSHDIATLPSCCCITKVILYEARPALPWWCFDFLTFRRPATECIAAAGQQARSYPFTKTFRPTIGQTAPLRLQCFPIVCLSGQLRRHGPMAEISPPRHLGYQIHVRLCVRD
jgi:hypothetical protein